MSTVTAQGLPDLTTPGGQRFHLPRPLVALRNTARQLQMGPSLGCPEIVFSDAHAWAAHDETESWLAWRARKCAERLRTMPVDIAPGECLPGRPRLCAPDAPAEADLGRARRAMASEPPFPGGDPGHFHPDHEKLMRLGIGGVRDEITQRLTDAEGNDRHEFYQACLTAIDALSTYAMRVGQACERMADEVPDERAVWLERAAVCRRVATDPPRTFHEAIQLMFITIIALWFGENHGLTCPGRMDRTLGRFYAIDLAVGRITPQAALELIACLYINLNRILWPGSAVAVMVGGRDAQGHDVTNDVTYLCLIARQLTALVYPTVALAWHSQTPQPLMGLACRMLATGIGDPALFNDELISAGLREHGVAPEDSVNYMNSTCVEIKVCGASNMWVTAPYFNLAQSLLDAIDTACESSQPADFASFEAVVQGEIAATVETAAGRLDEVWRQRAQTGCFPLASCLISDCLERGLDYDRGGARYNWVENSFVGLANLCDGLLGIRDLVFDARELSLAELRDILRNDFAGHEALRKRIRAFPCYGTGNNDADRLVRRWADFLVETTESNTIGGHRYVPGFFCWVQHERLGSQTGATPDGRKAGLPFADGAGAAQGRESKGPTASILSTTAWCHRKALGGLVHNAKFARASLQDAQGRRALQALIETYLRRGGFQIQVNVTNAEVLRDAQANPERHADLIVRVAGYSDYFTHLNRNMQDEVIARTEHELQ